MILSTNPMVLLFAHRADKLRIIFVLIPVPFFQKFRALIKKRVFFIFAEGTNRQRCDLLGDSSFPNVTVFAYPKYRARITGTYLVCCLLIFVRPVSDQLRIFLPEGTVLILTTGFAIASAYSFKWTLILNVSVCTDPFTSNGRFESDLVRGIRIIIRVFCKQSRQSIIFTVCSQRSYISHLSASL